MQLSGTLLLFGLQAIERTDRGFQLAVGTAAGNGGANLGLLHAVASLGHVHLLAQAFDAALGFGDVFAHAFSVPTELGGLLLLHVPLVGQGRNGFGHFQGEVFTVGLDSGHRLGFQVFDLGVVLANAISRQFVLGHDAYQFTLGVGQGAVGIANFLVEDAQGLLVDDRFADFAGTATQRGEQFAPDGLSHWIFPNN